jgi:hypothetical protein
MMSHELTVPPVTASGYRLWTVDHGLPFGAVRPNVHNRIAMCTTDRCVILYTPTNGAMVVAADTPVEVNAYERGSFGGKPHALDGTRYSCLTDAQRALYEAGLLAYMVSDEHAGAAGLPIG